MHALSAADILHVWEVGRGQSHVERAVTLLERACPETDRAALVHLPLGVRDRLLLEVRAGVLGEALEATAVCPACDERLEFRLAIGDLLGGESTGGVAQTGDPSSAREGTEFEMAVAGYELRFRLLDSVDLLAAAACPDAEAARSTLVDTWSWSEATRLRSRSRSKPRAPRWSSTRCSSPRCTPR